MSTHLRGRQHELLSAQAAAVYRQVEFQRGVGDALTLTERGFQGITAAIPAIVQLVYQFYAQDEPDAVGRQLIVPTSGAVW